MQRDLSQSWAGRLKRILISLPFGTVLSGHNDSSGGRFSIQYSGRTAASHDPVRRLWRQRAEALEMLNGYFCAKLVSYSPDSSLNQIPQSFGFRANPRIENS